MITTSQARRDRRGLVSPTVPAHHRRRNRVLPPWAFLAPAAVAYLVIVIYPFFGGATAAFTDWNGLNQNRDFVGFANFAKLFNDTQARQALLNTVLIAVVVTVAQNVIGLGLALLLQQRLKTRGVLRTLFFLPAVLAPLVMGYVWRYMYAPNGVLNQGLGLIGLGRLQQDWLGNPHLALWALLVAMTWQYIGYSTLIFIAGLEAIPAELYEAAALDGAGAWARFTRITFPLIAPATTINLMLTLIGGLKAFDPIMALTGGGPGYATETLSTILYRNAFVNGRYGYGAAVALVLSAIVSIFAMAQLSVLRRGEARMQ
ncbi:MAG: sugar ABC transporter permease [Micrococcales bacterium]|nr:sugar ABC transporter permease [Micrococcales bacterium]